MSNVKVGDTLYFVPERRGRESEARPVTVTKIGRIWITTDAEWVRFSVEKFEAHGFAVADGRGYASPGTVYANKAAYEERRDRQSAWLVVRKAVSDRWAPPEHLTRADIKSILFQISREDLK